MGSVVVARDGGGIVRRSRYSAYGSTDLLAGATPPASGPQYAGTYGYAGMRFDQRTGLYDANARWYEPRLGRFLQADPIVPSPYDPQTLNRYSYVVNDPVSRIDPSGHEPVCYDVNQCAGSSSSVGVGSGGYHPSVFDDGPGAGARGPASVWGHFKFAAPPGPLDGHGGVRLWEGAKLRLEDLLKWPGIENVPIPEIQAGVTFRGDVRVAAGAVRVPVEEDRLRNLQQARTAVAGFIAADLLRAPWLRQGTIQELVYDSVDKVPNDIAGSALDLGGGKLSIILVRGCSSSVQQGVECIAHELGHANPASPRRPDHRPENDDDPVYDFGRRARDLYLELRGR